MGDHSHLSDFENTVAPMTTPENTVSTSKKKTFWSKSSDWTADNIGKIVVSVISGLILAYLLYKLGWKKP